MKRNQILLFIAFVSLGAFNISAATLPLQEGFETHLDGTPLNTLGNGWGASSNAVVIRTVAAVFDAVRGTNALAIPESMTASNGVTTVALTNVWVDLYVNTNMAMDASLVGEEWVDTNLTVEVFLNTNGCPVVWNPASNAWVVYTQDYWQTNMSVFNTSQWARLTLCENYSNKTASLFMNEHLIVTGLRFINTNQTSYTRFQTVNGSAQTSYVDEVSLAYAPPVNMADLDNDGTSEAQEIQLYGNTTTWAWRAVTVTAPVNGTAGLSAASVIPGGQVTCLMTGNVAYGVASILTDGSLAASFDGSPRTASCVISNIWADTTLTVNFTNTGLRLVTSDYATLQLAVSAAQTGDTIVVSAGASAGDVTFSKSLTLVVSNGAVDVGTLTVQAGVTVQVVNATAFVADGATNSGTFTLDSRWGTVVIPQTPPYSDSLDRYAVGTKLSRMGHYGWEASSSNILIQNTTVQSNLAVAVPANDTLASVMTPTSASNVWFELYYQDTNRMTVESVTLDFVNTNVAVEAFINTNGYVTVFEPVSGQWDVCSNDVQTNAVAKLANDAWPRISVNLNYTRGRAAVFLDGRLLRQELRFINTNLVNSGRFEIDGGCVGPTYLDTYSVWTNSDGIVSASLDHDSWADAWEIDQNGNISQSPISGSIFRIR